MFYKGQNSAAEVQSQLYVALDQNYISEEAFKLKQPNKDGE